MVLEAWQLVPLGGRVEHTLHTSESHVVALNHFAFLPNLAYNDTQWIGVVAFLA